MPSSKRNSSRPLISLILFLREVVEAHDKVLNEPELMICLHELGDSSVNFIVRPWVERDDYRDVYWDIIRAVKLRIDEEGISIPFPQRDVHLYTVH
ncbi:MAG: mechanosensitive ion channel [Gammaproteobacteria bacterium]|nr:mechanosensitive ion channel [Gammaproteobacteria bacterium]